MAAIAGLRTATSMLYYSAQRYDPRLRQQQPTSLPTTPLTPLILLGHLPRSFRTSRISYPPSIFSRIALLIRSGTPSLLIRDVFATSSSNRGSGSRWYNEYPGRTSALVNTTIFESDDTNLNSFAGDDPASVKEPDSGERQTPSIESMLSPMRLGARVITPPPSSVIRQPGDTIEETDRSGKWEEILEQAPSLSEIPGLALGTSNSPSDILDQHPEYDSVYDSSEEEETISDFLVGQDPDDHVDDTYSFGQSISMSDIRVSISSNRVNSVSLPTRPPSVASSSNSSIRFRYVRSLSATSSSTSSIRFRPMGSSIPHRQTSILSRVYEQRAQATPGRSTSFNPNGVAVPSRRVTFADPITVPSAPILRAHKVVAWWKAGRLSKKFTRFYLRPSRRQHPGSTKPDAPSQPISSAANSIATSDGNVETHPPQPPSPPQSPAHSIRHRRTRINLRRVISAILPCIPISKEPDESGKAEPKERPRPNGIFSNPLGRWRKKNKNNIPRVQDMAEVKTLQVQVDR